MAANEGGNAMTFDIKTSKKSSWAIEVEEEHEATGWTGLPLQNSEGSSLPAEEGGKKPKNNKKKKNRKKEAWIETKTGIDPGKVKSKNCDDGSAEEVEALHNGKYEAEPKAAEFMEKKSGSDTVVPNDSLGALSLNEGWEVASSRKSRRNEDTQRNHHNYSTTPSATWTKSRVGQMPSPQAWRSTENSIQVGLLGQSPGEEWETVTKNKGKGQSHVHKVGKTETRFPKNEIWGSKSLSTDDNRFPKNEVWGSKNLGNDDNRFPKNEVWGSKSLGTDDNRFPKNEVWGGKSLSTEDNQNMNTISAAQAGSSGTAKDHRALATGVGAPQTDIKSPSVYTGRQDPKSSAPNPNILLKLLPSEKDECINSVGSVGSGIRERGSSSFHCDGGYVLNDLPSPVHSDSVCSDADLASDSDWIGSDDFDSDASDVSHDTKKQNKWFRPFFDTLDDLTNEQLNEHDRQWHCPVCKGGVGAIDWYRGLQPLVAHAKTLRSKRVRLHREFAEVVEEELGRRGASAGTMGDGKFGKWKGLREDDEATNPLIVWPPMVVIQNTQLELDEQEKWIGMGNKELLELFKEYNVMKARHAYGPQGHRGMSLVIFADSPTGYMDAQRLEKHFKDARRGREHWDHPGKIKYYPGGNRVLYGYMATAEDMDIFNRHSSGKGKLKWEHKRYQEAVVQPMRQMDEDNHQLNWLKVKVQKQKEHSRTLEKTVSVVAKKLELRDEEIRVIRQRALEQHEENQKEMDYLEETYKERIIHLSNDSSRREEELQKKQEEFKQEHIRRCQQLEKTCAKIPENKKLAEDQQQQQQAKIEEAIAIQTELVESSLRDSEDYEFQKRELTKKQHLKRLKFRREQYEQALRFEEEVEKEKAELLERYRRQREESQSKVE